MIEATRYPDREIDAPRILMAAGASDEPDAPAPTRAATNRTGDAIRILIVEDEEDLLFLLVERFRWEGFEVISASTRRHALAQIAEGQLLPDLVLLDLMLPDGSGLDVLRALRSSDRARRTRVVILSGLGDERSIEEGLRTGADAYLAKPVTIETLIETIRSVARKSSN